MDHVSDRAPHLLVIDPSVYVAETQGAAKILEGWRGTSRVVRPALTPSDKLDPGQGYDGVDAVVVMGSAASVHDDMAWIEDLKRWLAPLLRGDVVRPVFGICFGHQLIAQLAGGEVGFLTEDHIKRVGVEESTVSPCRLLSEGGTLRVIVSHREYVRTPPPSQDYAVTAHREGVWVDALEHQRLPIFGVQFHPEARDNFATRARIDLALVDSRLNADGDRVLAAFRAWAWGYPWAASLGLGNRF